MFAVEPDLKARGLMDYSVPHRPSCQHCGALSDLRFSCIGTQRPEFGGQLDIHNNWWMASCKYCQAVLHATERLNTIQLATASRVLRVLISGFFTENHAARARVGPFTRSGEEPDPLSD